MRRSGPADVALGFRNVPALPPGSSSSGSTSIPVPSGTAPGTYYVIAKANADSSTPETNVTNNTRSIKIVIGPDLFLASLSAPATGGAGLPVDVTDTTKNQGAGSAAASRTAFYLSANATLGAGDVLLGSRPVGVLLPNSSSTTTTTLTIPAGTPAGSYYIIAVADDGGAVLGDQRGEQHPRRPHQAEPGSDRVVDDGLPDDDLLVCGGRLADQRHRDDEEPGRGHGDRDDDEVLPVDQSDV